MRHIAIITDGSRRWARSKGLPVKTGYLQSLLKGENCCDWAIKNKIEYLTFYGFSTENWKRDNEEVKELFELIQAWIEERKNWCKNRGIKVTFIGRKDRLPNSLLLACYNLEKYTENCNSLKLQICLDYGGRDEIVRAIQAGAKTEEEITQILTSYAPEPDLILRPGGRKRISNFFIWQAAYSELIFLDEYFPDLTFELLDMVMQEYLGRARTYGGN